MTRDGCRGKDHKVRGVELLGVELLERLDELKLNDLVNYLR